MSNCIDIVYGKKVTLSTKEVDGYKLRELLMKAEKEVNCENSSSETIDAELRIAWWFLCRNTKITPRHGAVIVFGAGRSSHTWRDFKGTLWVLKKFIKKSVIINFGFKDEYDGFKTIERENIDLEVGLS